MNCINCGAPMKFVQDKHHFFCEHCTSIYFPEESRDGIRIFEEFGDVNCPVCKVTLFMASIDEAPVLYCSKCKGILVKQATLLAAVQYLYLRTKSKKRVGTLPPMSQEDLKRRLDCPYCGQVMDTHPYGGPGNMVVDNCLRCEVVWLDYDDYRRITKYFEGSSAITLDW